MPNILSIILLALVQGITEFLPISSSGHLVLAQELFGLRIPGAGLEIALHAGTLVSILVFYRKDLVKLLRPLFESDTVAKAASWKRIGLLVVASVPIV
ncbi:undecaprenyl-diphosphatase, partial [bacterium]